MKENISFVEKLLKLSRNGKIDVWAMIIGGVVIVLNLLFPSCTLVKWVVVGTAFLGAYYVGFPIYLFCRKRVEFDWHLIYGHYLRKVVALVLLMPSVITAAFMFVSLFPSCDVEAKDLVYDENLYEPSVAKDTLLLSQGVVNDTLWAKSHACEVRGDSVFVSKTNLPESISDKQVDPPLYWSVYYHFIDPGNQHMSTSYWGRICAALAAILGVFLLNGLLVSSIIGWIDRRKEKWLNGELDYKLSDLGKYQFAVVIGANEIASSVIRNLLSERKENALNNKNEGDNRYILLQTNHDVSEVRDILSSHLTTEELHRVLLYKAPRDSYDELQKLYPEYSTEIYVLGEYSLLDGGESFHDTMNMRCVNLLAKHLNSLLEERKNDKSAHSVRRVCKVLFEYQTTQSVFHFSDVESKIRENLVFLPFNRYESWARTVIVENKAANDFALTISKNDKRDSTPLDGEEGIKASTLSQNDKRDSIDYTPLDGKEGIKATDDTHVHFVVVGMSKMGVAMGLQAMLQAHYVNYAQAETIEDEKERELKKSLRRTRITFIDTNMDKEKDFFMGRYANMFKLMRHRYFDANACEIDDSTDWIDPIQKDGRLVHLCRDGKAENFIDIEVEFVKGELESSGVRSYLETLKGKIEGTKLTIAICLPKTHEAIAASLYMPISIYDKAQEIWVYQREASDIVNNLRKTSQKDKRYEKLRPFGMIYGEFMCDRSLYLKGIIVNGAYDLKGSIAGKKYTAENRDMANKETYSDLKETWGRLTLDQRLSNKYFADSIYAKLRAVLDKEKYKELCNSYPDEILIQLKNLLTEKGSKEKEYLARCEHNRWNIQQLLFGYATCTKMDDEKFKMLNEKREKAKSMYDDWKGNVGWKSMSPLERIECKDKNTEYANLPHGVYDKEKKNLKTGLDRIHPNICDYNHLDEIDSGAKGYDEYINAIIPEILKLVDKRIGKFGGVAL